MLTAVTKDAPDTRYGLWEVCMTRRSFIIHLKKNFTPTHLTQCCACWSEAVKRGIIGKSETQVKDINENRKTYNTPRGGTLTCKKNMEKDFDKRRDLLTPFIIGASVITALILCCMLGIWWMASVDLSNLESTDMNVPVNMPFLVKL